MSGTVTVCVCSSKLRLVLSIRLHSYHDDLFSTAILTTICQRFIMSDTSYLPPSVPNDPQAYYNAGHSDNLCMFKFRLVLSIKIQRHSCLLAPRFQPPFANYDSEVHHERYSLQPSYRMCPSRMTPPTRMHNPLEEVGTFDNFSNSSKENDGRADGLNPPLFNQQSDSPEIQSSYQPCPGLILKNPAYPYHVPHDRSLSMAHHGYTALYEEVPPIDPLPHLQPQLWFLV